MTQFFSFVLRSSIAVLLGAVLLWQPLHAQQPSPAIEWQKSLGGSGLDGATSIIQTRDGGYIVAGSSTSNDDDVSGHHGSADFSDSWIVKLTSTGGMEWQKSLGGSGEDDASSIVQTNDGGYIVAGGNTSTDGDVSGHHGSADFLDCWIVKLTNGGDVAWQKSLGGGSEEYANSIQQTNDGGYIVAGRSYSTDGDVSGPRGSVDYGDYWVVKLTSAGAIEWEKSLGGNRDDWAESITQTGDGGYIVAGLSYSTDGNVSGHHGSANSSDYWIVKLTSEGAIEWEKSLGGSGEDVVGSITQTSDGGYIVAGGSKSTDGDVSGYHGQFDYWIVKLTSAGAIEWQKSLGGRHHDHAGSIAQTSDGEYIIAGLSSSKDGDANSIAQTADGGYIVAGVSYSNNGNATGNHIAIHYTDFWIVKLAPSNSTGR